MPEVGQVSRTPPAIGVAVRVELGGPRGAEPTKVTLRTCSAMRPAMSVPVNLMSYEPVRLAGFQKAAQGTPDPVSSDEPRPNQRGSGMGAGTTSQPPETAGA